MRNWWRRACHGRILSSHSATKTRLDLENPFWSYAESRVVTRYPWRVGGPIYLGLGVKHPVQHRRISNPCEIRREDFVELSLGFLHAFGPGQRQPGFQRESLHHATIMSFDARSRAPQIRARAIPERKSCERGKNRGKRAC